MALDGVEPEPDGDIMSPSLLLLITARLTSAEADDAVDPAGTLPTNKLEGVSERPFASVYFTRWKSGMFCPGLVGIALVLSEF
jgi:hypothetical protein